MRFSFVEIVDDVALLLVEASVPEAGCRPKGGVPKEFHGRIAVPDSSDRVLGHYAGFAQFTVADNGTLLYRRGGGDSGALALVWVDRQGQVEPLAAERRPYGDFGFRPMVSVYSKAADGTAVGGTFVSVEVVDSPYALAIVTAR